MLSDHKVRAKRNRDKNWGRLIKHVRRGATCKKLKHLEAVISESVCSETTISKKKSFCIISTNHQIIVI